VPPDIARPGTGAVLIELGTDRGEPDAYEAADRAGARPPGLGRTGVLAALLAVLVGAGASAAPPPPALHELLVLQVAPADTYALTDDGLLVVHTPATGMLAAYELADGRLRWQAGATAPAYRVRSGGGLVLLRPRVFGETDPGTIALAARNGAARWRHAGSVVAVAGSPTVLAVAEVRSLSGTGRRVEGAVVGVDPDTGRTRWSLPVPSTAVLQDLPGTPSRAVLVHDSGAAGLLDLATGRMLAEAQLPPADYGPGNPGVSGGMILLRHPGPQGTQVTAYDPVTLQQRWSRPAGYAYEVRACGDLACLVSSAGVRAVDPVDGADRWSSSGWRTIEQRGGVLLAYGSLPDDTDLIGVVDPDTGRIAVTLHSWRPVPGPGGGDHVLLTRPAPGEGGIVLAVADRSSDRPRVLGELPAGTGDCRAVPGRLVCRSVSGMLKVWSYRDGVVREH
jgi:hypothetical protein